MTDFEAGYFEEQLRGKALMTLDGNVNLGWNWDSDKIKAEMRYSFGYVNPRITYAPQVPTHCWTDDDEPIGAMYPFIVEVWDRITYLKCKFMVGFGRMLIRLSHVGE